MVFVCVFGYNFNFLLSVDKLLFGMKTAVMFIILRDITTKIISVTKYSMASKPYKICKTCVLIKLFWGKDIIIKV